MSEGKGTRQKELAPGLQVHFNKGPSSTTGRNLRFVGRPEFEYLRRMDQQYEISTDAGRFDVGLIHKLLDETYWARHMPRQVLERAIRHSLCFGAFTDGRQVAFARVITDFATFAYLSDVFVVPEHRRRGVGTLLMNAILEHPELQGLRRFVLITKDAHGLYAQFGFKPLSNPEEFMNIHNPHVYAATESRP